MTPWEGYLAAVAHLDEVRREADAAAAQQLLAVRAASDELATVRTRIALQRGRIAEVATQTGQQAPGLDPLDVDRAAAALVVAPAGGDPTPGITVAVQGIRATLDAADATLSVVATVGEHPGFLAGWTPAARHGLVYGWQALLALVALLEISSIAGASPRAQLVVAVFALVVPAGAWLLGWITVRVLFGATPRPRGLHRGPPAAADRGSNGGLLGAAICAVPMLVGMFLSVA